MIDLSNPYEVRAFAEQEGIPVEAVYNMEITHKTDLIQKMPENARLYFERGDAYFYIKNYEAAIDDFLKAIELNPKDPRYFHYVGDCFAYTNQYPKAVEYYSKALEFTDYKQLVSVYKQKAEVHFHMGEFENALKDINEAIKIVPSGISDLYKLRAVIYKGLGDEENGEKDFETWHIQRVQSLMASFQKMSQRQKQDILFNLFSNMTDEQQNEFIAEGIFNYSDDIL